MSEYIVSVSSDEAEYFISRFGIGGTQIFGHQLLGKIVRCRDCKHLNIVGKCPCGFWALENLDGFCAWAESEDE